MTDANNIITDKVRATAWAKAGGGRRVLKSWLGKNNMDEFLRQELDKTRKDAAVKIANGVKCKGCKEKKVWKGREQ